MRTLLACHVHSEWSYDGSWTLEALASEFGRRGYQAILTTEHDRGFTPDKLDDYRAACARVSSSSIHIVPGIEYSDASNTVHILTWGDIPFLGEGLATRDLLEAVKQHDGIAVLAHPSRRNAWKVVENSWIELLDGIELWNRKTDGWCPSREAAQLLRRFEVAPYLGIDFHTARQQFPIAMSTDSTVDVRSPELLEALRRSKFRPWAFGSYLGPARAKRLGTLLAPPEFLRRSVAWSVRRTLRAAKPS
jgi:predicted metal-dependent phosphoesterase TrpH